VQFLPVVLLPQLLLSGLLAPVETMPGLFHFLSHFLPLTYSVDAMKKVMMGQGSFTHDFELIALFLFFFLAAGALTLKRKSK